jgi:nucleoside-diphosphate-sugar epimerase
MIYQAYGPGQAEHTLVQAAIKAAIAQETFPMTSGSQQRDWIYISDVVEGFIAALNVDLEPGISVEIGTGQATSVADVVQTIFQMIGGDGKQMPGVLPDRPGEPALQLADVERTGKLIKWQAKVTLDVGLGLIIDLD